MDINPASLLSPNALNNSLGGADKLSASPKGTSFMDLIKQGVETVRDAQLEGEKMTASALIGKADMSQVVQSVAKAEVMLQTMVSVRDRLLSAYQEIMNTRI